jgi:hypothetical protein
VAPERNLRPRSSMDRMANGEHIGQCPTCGGHQWWDNRSRKAAGETGDADPDYRCTTCRHGRWEDCRSVAGRSGRRAAPPARVTVLETAPEASADAGAGRICAARTKSGAPCRNGAMAGSPFCGPHSDSGAGTAAAARSTGPLPNQCLGTTKAGKPCRAAAERGSSFCPQHQPG